MERVNHCLSLNKQQLGSWNKRRVLDCISENQPINRAAIAQMIGLSVPAVMTITEELMSYGIIQSIGRAESGVGKHPELFSLCGERFRYVGVDVGRINMRAVLMGHDGRVLSSAKILTNNAEHPKKCMEDICGLINRVIDEADIDLETLVGICVAMPGLIEQGTGRVIFSPDFAWKAIPLQEWLNQEIKTHHVIVKNANRAQLKWEVRPEKALDKDMTVFCMGLGFGIGSALITKGEMHYGSSGTSGEIGHITVNPDGPLCSCGNNGCLEAMASGYAIQKIARKMADTHRESMLYKMVDGDIHKITAKEVFEAATMNDEISMTIIDKAARYIGIALAAAINMLDPDVIYLCGGLLKNGPDFIEQIKKYTRNRQMHLAGRHVKILRGSEDEFNVAKGAALMIQDFGWEFEALSFLF